MIHFSNNLRIKRKQLGWTQSKAAEELAIKTKEDITERRYQQWELGRSEPDFNILVKIAEVFVVDDLYLFMAKPLD